ncbi:MAG: hypothetical protein OXC48_02565 [Endozoicomonadaceae bacterium]|nr:hypothetical protein [Endozoicomonadaceae bacterium]
MSQLSWNQWFQQTVGGAITSEGKLKGLWSQGPEKNKQIITLLTDEDVLTISGKDAIKFLQGQSTCDVEKLTQGEAVTGSCCTPKGRMIANFRLIKADQELLYLTLPRGQAENLRSGLSKYAPFYKVDLSSQNSWIRIGLQTDDASIDHLRTDFLAGLAGFQPFTVAIDEQRAEVWLQEEEFVKLPEQFITQYNVVSTDVWRLDELRRGIAWVQPMQTEKWLPQECNQELIGGVSFKKGCYTGQEIVARLHYRGQTKKRLQYFSFITETEEHQQIIDQKIVNAENKPCGFVVNAICNPQSRQMHLLANVRLDLSEQPLFLESNLKKTLQHHSLPYTIDNG